MENAKIYAENVIRNRKEALNLRRFGVKMGALSAKLESAYRTQEVSKSIAESIPMLKKCMKDMDSIGVSTFKLIIIRWLATLGSSKKYSKT